MKQLAKFTLDALTGAVGESGEHFEHCNGHAGIRNF